MEECPHETFDASVTVDPPEEGAIAYQVTLAVRCAACEAPLLFDLAPRLSRTPLFQGASMGAGGIEAYLMARMSTPERPTQRLWRTVQMPSRREGEMAQPDEPVEPEHQSA